MKKAKNALSIILSLLMVMSSFSILPLIALADEGGELNSNCSWSYNSSTETLTVSGDGGMGLINNAPWSGLNIRNVVIGEGVTSVNGFKGTAVKKVTFPSTVEIISESSFEDCKMLKEVDLPASLISIADKAFSGCIALKRVSIAAGDNVASIGPNAFSDCAALEDVTLPDTVKCINDAAFSACKALKSIEIPKDVKEIPYSCFYGCRSLSNVILPDGLEKIESAAFYYCSSIKYINIPRTVNAIGTNAFSDCSSLTSIAIPTGVTKIDDSTFYNCISLKAITIPYSVTDMIGYHMPFDGCISLSDVYFTGDAEEWSNVNGIDSDYICNAAVHFDSSDTNEYSLVDVPAPSGENSGVTGACVWSYDAATRTMTVSGNGAMGTEAPWADFEIKKLIVNEGVTVVRGFKNLSLLKTVELADSVTVIGDSAFSDCKSLKSVSLGNGIVSIGTSAFSECAALEEITLPDSVKYINGAAFSGTALKSIEIPKDVSEIPYDCFYRCRALSNVILPKGLKSIGSGAFYYCSSIKYINIPRTVNAIGTNAFSDCSSLTSIIIPMGVTKIDDSTFYNCISLKSITIPYSVTSMVGYHMPFDGCISLSDVYFTGDAEEWQNITGINSDYICNAVVHLEESDTNEYSLVDVAEPSGENCGVTGACVWSFDTATKTMTVSGNGAMGTETPWSALDIRKLVVTDGVTVVRGFGNQLLLESVEFADSVTVIGDSAFSGCKALCSASLGNGIVSIGANAFSDCAALEEITLPDSVKYINSNAFSGCKALKSIEIPKDVRIIPYQCFYGCTSLASVILPDGLEKIEDSAFYNCSSIKYIKIPSTVNSIGANAFSGCSSLKSIVIPSGVTSIGDGTFRNCSSLKVVTIPHTVTSLVGYHDPFEGCIALTDVYFTGDEKQWDNITGKNFEPNVVIHFGEEAPEHASHVPAAAVMENVIEATCTENGSYDSVVYCTVCGEKLSSEAVEISALGHNYQAEVNAPTCTANGFTTYTCTRCGESYTGNESAALGHDYKSVVTAPTCTTGGYTTYTCTVCGDEYIANETCALGHVIVNDKAVEATFKTSGKTAGKHCSACGKTIVAQKTVAKLVSPTVSKLTAGKKLFTATWKKAPTVDGYQLQYATNSKFTKAKSVTIKGDKTAKTTVKKLTAKKKYYVRVRAYKTINGKKVYSSWSKSKTVTTKK